MAKQINKHVAGERNVKQLSNGRKRFQGQATPLGGEVVCVQSLEDLFDFTVVQMMSSYDLKKSLRKAENDGNAVLQQYLGKQWKILKKELRMVSRRTFLATGSIPKGQPTEALVELRQRLSKLERARVLDASYMLKLLPQVRSNSMWHGIAFGRIWQRMLDRSTESDIERGAITLAAAKAGGLSRSKLTPEQCERVVQELSSATKVSLAVKRLAKEYMVDERTIYRCWEKHNKVLEEVQQP